MKWLGTGRGKRQPFDEGMGMPSTFHMTPVGTIHKTDAQTWIEIEAPYRPAMDGLEGFSHIHVLFWFHENDHAEGRQVLKVHPRKDTRNPLTGVFATHSPLRPNLIGMTLCRVVAVEPSRIVIDRIDAFDGTPVLDIKCYIPSSRSFENLHLPEWV
jgi:tRNA-Thr(GGU) m(6)t(6)A37 methyltransferase TsaA